MSEPSDSLPPHDALLLLSFGGPEGPEEVRPFLEHVTRGRGVPEARLLEVEERYQAFGGRSPIHEHARALLAGIRQALTMRGPQLPVYFANRHSAPFLAETIAEMARDGIQRALCFATSAFGSHSGCRSYLEAIEEARSEVGEFAPIIEKSRLFYNHPGFIEPMTERVEQALEKVPAQRRGSARLAFTAHSIPLSMEEVCPYVDQLEEACRLVAEAAGKKEW
ncbi:MAG: ferrochelatase, partial [Myxococcales bacterium]|nr:ferrochelatase [Myxococcales bacterium]